MQTLKLKKQATAFCILRSTLKVKQYSSLYFRNFTAFCVNICSHKRFMRFQNLTGTCGRNLQQLYHNCSYIELSKSRNYKERQVDEQYRKVFVTAHVVLRKAAMFLASAPNKGSYPREYLKIPTNTWGKYFCLGQWLTIWRL